MVAASMFITYETATRIPRLHYRDVEPRFPIVIDLMAAKNW